VLNNTGAGTHCKTLKYFHFLLVQLDACIMLLTYMHSFMSIAAESWINLATV